jgi:hypothetical protein
MNIRTMVLVITIGMTQMAFSVAPESKTSEKEPGAQPPSATSSISSAGIKQLIFEEQKIEGKIRRPQLVLIKADQRPEFNPMVMQSLGKTKNIAGLVDQGILEETRYQGAFKFEGTRIVNIVP